MPTNAPPGQFRSTGDVINNKLNKGLITEATGLNFPEDAATDALNVVFDPIGGVRRRLGIDLEGNAEALSYTDDTGLVTEFLWKAVAQTGGFEFLVMQTGTVIHFYKMTDDANLSHNILPATLNLNTYKAPEGKDIAMTPCSFASGGGNLYIAHPACDPIIVRWNQLADDFEAAKIDIRIRDFQGVDDNLGVSEEPSSLSNPHYYNLLNQGWDQKVRIGTVTNDIGIGGSLSGVTDPPDLVWVQL